MNEPSEQIVARLQPTKVFLENNRNIFRTEAQLRHLANNRRDNGLVESGAVYELGTKLFWYPPGFCDWLTGRQDNIHRAAQ